MAKKSQKVAERNQPHRPNTYVVRSLEQAKLLSDPLRLRILQAFVEEPRTTKQVAEFLGENPPKLYRHVEALHKAGLLELKAEKQKRGTIEKYLQTIAIHFVIDPALFLSGSAQKGSDQGRAGMVDTILEMARDELKQLLRHKSNDGSPKPLVLRAQVRGSQKNIERMRENLMNWVESCHSSHKEEQDDEETVEYAAIIAFYPIVKTK